MSTKTLKRILLQDVVMGISQCPGKNPSLQMLRGICIR